MELNSSNNFGRASPKKHSCQVLMKTGPVVLEKKMFKEIVDGRQMPDIGRSQ